nr:hypothetical protein [Propionibacterium sp.]
MTAADGAGEALDAVASACAFLAHLLLRPEAADAVAQLDPAFIADWPLARDADTVAGLAALDAFVRHPAPSDALRADYAALFVGPGPMLACPWESVHRGEDRLVFDRQTFEVRRAYAAYGLQAPALNREPDDHVGLELAFVGALAAAALDALERGDDGEVRRLAVGAVEFCTEHLEPWVPGFAAQVTAGAATPLYRALGLLLAGALAQFGPLLSTAVRG